MISVGVVAVVAGIILLVNESRHTSVLQKELDTENAGRTNQQINVFNEGKQAIDQIHNMINNLSENLNTPNASRYAKPFTPSNNNIIQAPVGTPSRAKSNFGNDGIEPSRHTSEKVNISLLTNIDELLKVAKNKQAGLANGGDVMGTLGYGVEAQTPLITHHVHIESDSRLANELQRLIDEATSKIEKTRKQINEVTSKIEKTRKQRASLQLQGNDMYYGSINSGRSDASMSNRGGNSFRRYSDDDVSQGNIQEVRSATIF